MAATSISVDLQAELNALILSLEGLERARYLAVAAIACFLYDAAVTFDQEVEYFWKGSWSLSRVLFFINRYFPLLALFMGLVAIIVLRICYVYSKDIVARAIVIGTLAVCTICTLVLFGTVWHDIDAHLPVPGITIDSCTAPPSREMWKIFVPSIILHTLLFLATTLPAVRLRRLGQQSMLVDRLVMDGGLFYFAVFAAAMFQTIGALAKTPLVTTPAIYSNVWLSLSSIAVSRLMLRIRSLAAQLSLEPDWLLNNTELSRVNWKRGPRNGEIIVEIDAIEAEDMEMDSVGHDPLQHTRSHTPGVIHVSRVGVLDHPVYPGTRDYKQPPRIKKPKVACNPEPPAYA
ncbi:hypothetical protein DICSQDRAFT_165251 [Dichomitus squalens LYAD-421 SS1]|uniref:uncharacterized protein n=1 Tax=Dichomitus squalens (strain LYAD-421) TaxID=732165 RepID=UPI00044141E4|nr:uncharacterized protein DICSQDRAFT_165251 [Dichomitus squalens LYAD-421 SS1]EJF67423.1 hypothetical protein DICSQDRAFT_165251 [Dichomitus squalens LYAD-421 SS1]